MESDPDFWSFASLRHSRSGNHALFQYPAMMVPELQGALLDDLLAADSGASVVYDPFAGSGTVLLESLYRGLGFLGADINPLAVLLCDVKANPPTEDEADKAVTAIVDYARRGAKMIVPVFPGVDKWFKPEIKQGLGQLKAAIVAQADRRVRRFMWVCLAETIRLISNSRTSTFKLHTYPADVIAKRETDAVASFESVTRRNVNNLTCHWKRMASVRTTPFIEVTRQSILSRHQPQQLADILMTSPPYGDNRTTVPYGQYSYLALSWIDGNDIPGGVDPKLLEFTAAIDSASLGGSSRGADSARGDLANASPALERFIGLINDAPVLRRKVLAFARDYKAALTATARGLKNGAFCFFTLGERRVDKKSFPLVLVTEEFLAEQGHEKVDLIERTLPGSHKRLAPKNSEGATMGREFILVTRLWKESGDDQAER
ncbi:MAG: hypothetical protein LBK42_12945 [Propionibacteriaceae bacterium]|nr:hypothetical protein [Propionibacteriaceae bacterium]